MKYPNWRDFDIEQTCYGCSAPVCGFGTYTLDRKFSWPDMECVTEDELKRWQEHIVSQGYEIPDEYKVKQGNP